MVYNTNKHLNCAQRSPKIGLNDSTDWMHGETFYGRHTAQTMLLFIVNRKSIGEIFGKSRTQPKWNTAGPVWLDLFMSGSGKLHAATHAS